MRLIVTAMMVLAYVAPAGALDLWSHGWQMAGVDVETEEPEPERISSMRIIGGGLCLVAILGITVYNSGEKRTTEIGVTSAVLTVTMLMLFGFS